jgi:hypothetical protein
MTTYPFPTSVQAITTVVSTSTGTIRAPASSVQPVEEIRTVLPPLVSSQSTELATVQSEDYQLLENSLAELNELDEEDDWKIEDKVYAASVRVALALMEKSVPLPSVFTHGPKSVVFNWTRGSDDLYLTVTSSKMYVLVSSQLGVQYRAEVGATLTDRTNQFFSALTFARLTTQPLLPYRASASPSAV